MSHGKEVLDGLRAETAALREKIPGVYEGFAHTHKAALGDGALSTKDKELIAFGIAMPSLSRALQKGGGRLFPFGWLHLLRALAKPEGLDLYLIAVKQEYQSSGVIAFMMTSLTQDCIKAGIKTAETAGELESNHAVQSLWKDFERRQHKRRRAYSKKL